MSCFNKDGNAPILWNYGTAVIDTHKILNKLGNGRMKLALATASFEMR